MIHLNEGDVDSDIEDKNVTELKCGKRQKYIIKESRGKIKTFQHGVTSVNNNQFHESTDNESNEEPKMFMVINMLTTINVGMHVVMKVILGQLLWLENPSLG